MGTNKHKEYSNHYPVLLAEVLDYLNVQDDKAYLDCTFGAGGYSEAILQQANCRLTALDQDSSTREFADQISAKYGDRFQFKETNFADAGNIFSNKFDGIVLDLGVSSMQLDQEERGFSFNKEGPLDMRMSSEGMSAADFVNNADETEIADVIYKYGEEPKSRRVAKAIVAARQNQAINGTVELATIVRKSLNYKTYSKNDPATKTFQAIRIHVNNELGALEQFLNNSKNLLADGGRLVVVSFHSLEDSIVKNFMKKHAGKKVARSKYAKEPEITDPNVWLLPLTKKPVVASAEELEQNIRSRSAKLRAAEKIGRGDND